MKFIELIKLLKREKLFKLCVKNHKEGDHLLKGLTLITGDYC